MIPGQPLLSPLEREHIESIFGGGFGGGVLPDLAHDEVGFGGGIHVPGGALNVETIDEPAPRPLHVGPCRRASATRGPHQNNSPREAG